MRPYNRAAVLIVDPHGEYDTLRTIETDTTLSRARDGYQPEGQNLHARPHQSALLFADGSRHQIPFARRHFGQDAALSLAGVSRLDGGRARQSARLWGYHDLRDAVTKQKYEGSDAQANRATPAPSRACCGGSTRALTADGAIFSDNEHIPLSELFQAGPLHRPATLRHRAERATGDRRHTAAPRQQSADGDCARRSDRRALTAIFPIPSLRLLEEAHRFAPAGQTVVSTNILKQILSEGRKFGVGIGLITQRPGKLDQDVLSQCMTQIIMRIVNPIDQDTIAKSVEGAGRQLLHELPALNQRASRHQRRRRQHARHVPHPPAHHQDTAAKPSTRPPSGPSGTRKRRRSIAIRTPPSSPPHPQSRRSPSACAAFKSEAACRKR